MKLFEGIFQINRDWYCRYQENGKSFMMKVKEPGEYYIEDQLGQYKSLIGNKPLKKVQGFPYNIDKTYGTLNPGYKHIRDNYWDVQNSKYNLNPRIWYIDIETTAETKIDVENTPQELVLIQIYDNISKIMYVLGSEEWYNSSKYTDKLDYEVKYLNCKTEENIFLTYFKLLEVIKPLVVFGWNTEGFDYPFLYNRCSKIGLDPNKFAINGNAKLTSRTNDKNQVVYSLSATGVYYSDLMIFFKKFVGGSRASYSLNNISLTELGHQKINHDDFSTFDGFRTGESYIFPKEPPTDPDALEMYNAQLSKDSQKIKELAYSKFVYYGLIDTKLVQELDFKLKLSDIGLAISSKMGIQFSDVLGTVKPWSQYLSNTLYLDKKIMPDTDNKDAIIDIKGGWVMESIPGKHHWVVSFDFASLYPSIMRAYNMSPETVIEPRFYTDNHRQILKLLQKDDIQDEDVFINLDLETKQEIGRLANLEDVCIGANGVFFTKKFKGVIPELLEQIYNERKAFKKEMQKYKQKAVDANASGDAELASEMKSLENQYNIKQLVSKTLLNSLN